MTVLDIMMIFFGMIVIQEIANYVDTRLGSAPHHLGGQWEGELQQPCAAEPLHIQGLP